MFCEHEFPRSVDGCCPVLFSLGKAEKQLTVNNVHELILQRQGKEDEAKVLPIKKKQHWKAGDLNGTWQKAKRGHTLCVWHWGCDSQPGHCAQCLVYPLEAALVPAMCPLQPHAFCFPDTKQDKVVKYSYCQNLLSLHSNGLQGFLKIFKKRTYHKASEIDFFMPQI